MFLCGMIPLDADQFCYFKNIRLRHYNNLGNDLDNLDKVYTWSGGVPLVCVTVMLHIETFLTYILFL